MKKYVVLVLLFSVSLLFAASEVVFSPGGKIQKKLLDRIEMCNESIDVMCYSFTSRSLAKSLLKAKERGLRVRVLLDRSQTDWHGSMYRYFKENAVDIRLLSGYKNGIMHNKIAIFDNKSIVTGSYNWTGSAEKYNYENVVFSDDKDLIIECWKEFDKLWGKAK